SRPAVDQEKTTQTRRGVRHDHSVILAFCPIVSRYGTNIEEALSAPHFIFFPFLTDEKPVVLVVMHHTSDPEYVVPSSSVYVKDRNIFTVDCLFFDDKGMLNCQRNYEAYDKVVQKLKEHCTLPMDNIPFLLNFHVLPC
uniref:Uncharacterized protein n=1 Tax=Denticeps clupeoides TaxID=299321 RepID=A0AAY4CHZ5_9TELE